VAEHAGQISVLRGWRALTRESVIQEMGGRGGDGEASFGATVALDRAVQLKGSAPFVVWLEQRTGELRHPVSVPAERVAPPTAAPES